MNQRQSRFLTELLSQPTAPFREHHVSSFISALLAKKGIPFFEDPHGNLIIGASSASAYKKLVHKKTRDPLRVFIAHMDHPGFHAQQWIAYNRLKIKWHGGSPKKHLARAKVWLANNSGYVGEGKLRNVVLLKNKMAIDHAEVSVPAGILPGKRPAANTLFGGLGFRAPVWHSGKRLYTKAADDLVGVYCIVETALKLFSENKNTKPAFIGMLTRGEEVGFVGAVAHFELGWLSKKHRPVVCVSLEASRTLPGAVVGKGPVIRLGDRRTVFSPDGMKLLSDLAQKLLPGKHQRRIMDGGACEATAATSYGFDTIGLSVPLGNYHNEGYEGGQDCKAPRGPAPEYVHVDDIDGMLKLCHGLMNNTLNWNDCWHDTRQRLRRNQKHYKRQLK